MTSDIGITEYDKIWNQEQERRAAFLSDNRPDEDDTLYQLIKVTKESIMNSEDSPIAYHNNKKILRYINPGKVDKKEIRFDLSNWVWPKKIRNKVCFAGGSVLGNLTDLKYKDIDVFIISDKPLKVLKTIVNMACGYINWNKNVVNISFIKDEFGHTLENVQIILRAYKSVSEVITGFDIDSCCVAYYEKNYYVTPRGKYAIDNSINTVNLALSSTSYEFRLLKYCNRGFNIQLPLNTPKEALEKAYSGNSGVRLKFTNNLGWLIWAYMGACYRSKQYYNRTRYNLVKGPSDYNDDKCDNKRNICLKDNTVINVTIHHEYSYKLFDKTYYKKYPNYDWTHIGKIPTFITVNPGSQNNSWSFKPLNIALEEWFNPDVIIKKRYNDIAYENVIKNYETPPYVPLYYKYPGPVSVKDLNSGYFLKLWDKQDVEKYCNYYNLPICKDDNEWLSLDPFKTQFNGWNTPRNKSIINDIYRCIDEANRNEFKIELRYLGFNTESWWISINSIIIKDIMNPKTFDFKKHHIPNPLYPIRRYLIEKNYIFEQTPFKTWVIFTIRKAYKFSIEYPLQIDLKWLMNINPNVTLISSNGKKFETHLEILVQKGEYFKSFRNFISHNETNVNSIMKLDYNDDIINMFIEILYYSSSEWIEKYHKITFNVYEFLSLLDYIQGNENIYVLFLGLVVEKISYLSQNNKDELSMFLNHLKDVSGKFQGLEEIITHCEYYSLSDDELIASLVDKPEWNLYFYEVYEDTGRKFTSSSYLGASIVNRMCRYRD